MMLRMLREGGSQGHCDDSTKVLIINGWGEIGKGSKIANNCVTSFFYTKKYRGRPFVGKKIISRLINVQKMQINFTLSSSS